MGKTLRGSIWMVVGFGSGHVLRLGSNLILTRLLLPEAFGLMALITVVFVGLCLLSDIGLDASIIQHKRGNDPDFLCTVWTVQIIRGLVLCILACCTAWPLAEFYQLPELVYMIPVASLTVLITGFQTTAVPLCSRNVQLRPLTVYQLLTQVFSTLVTIALAWTYRSVWALVLGSVLAAGFQTIIGYYLLPGISHRFMLDRNAAREIIRFGKWLFVATGIGFIAAQAADKLILGKLVSPELLGIYSVAFSLAQLPASIVNMLMGRVLYASLSEVARRDASVFAQKLLFARNIVWPPLLFLVAALGFLSPMLFKTLWDPRYFAAGWMLQLMLICFWFDGLNSSLNAALMARGDSFASVVYNTAMLVVGFPSMIIGYIYEGVPGMIIGMAAGRAAAHIVLHLMLIVRGVKAWPQDVIAHLWFLSLMMAVLLTSGVSAKFLGMEVSAVGSIVNGDRIPIIVATICTTGALILCLKTLSGMGRAMALQNR